ncbi:hypothetical protein ACFSQJ_18045 [Croceitalea marina]|uniref:Uncharacterized protein n=1 Tax=Croceitalea marina TaxID=1775166 RepID=A0ABW5N3L2_9FLAO
MFRNILFFVLLGFFLTGPHAHATNNMIKKPESIHVADYFVYHGITDIVTEKMKSFTKKYNIGFRNKGCNMLNTTATKEHNMRVAENLSNYLGSTQWIDELPMKILGVN